MNKRLLSGCAMVLSYTAFLSWLFCISRLENDCTYMDFSPWIFVLFYLAVYGLNLLMVKKSTNLTIYVAFQLLMAAASVVLFLFTSVMEPFSLGTVIFMGIFTVGGVFACAYGASEPVEPKKPIFYFDSMVVLMIILLLLNHSLELFLVTPTLILCFIAMALSMLSLISVRVAQEKSISIRGANHIGGQILILLIVVLILLLSALLVIFAASGAKSLSETLYAGFKWCCETLASVGKFLMAKLEAFMLWLTQFLPEFEYDALTEGASASAEGGSTTSSDVAIPKYFFYIAAAIGIFLLLRFLLSMRKEDMGQEKTTLAVNTDAKRTGTLASGLRQLFWEIRLWLQFRYDRIRYRRSAPGLLLWCESRVPKAQRRKTGESGSAFLLRITAGDLSEPQKTALHTLAELTEQCFYSPVPVSVPQNIYKTIKTCKFK